MWTGTQVEQVSTAQVCFLAVFFHGSTDKKTSASHTAKSKAWFVTATDQHLGHLMSLTSFYSV